MLSRYYLAIVGFVLTISSTRAANDWSKPCFDGECAYDLPASSGGSGAIKLFGSPASIADITPAAGWVILDCDSNVLEQDIRLVCESDHAGSGCQHLFDHQGPIDKIVRLPEWCSNGPFARVANMAIAKDQSLPTHALANIRRRDGTKPEVHIMTIDSNFAAMDHAKAGDINFAFIGATVPGLDLNEAFVDWPWDDIAKWVSNAASTVAKAVTNSVNWVGDRLQDVSNLIQNKTAFEIGPKVESSDIPLDANIVLSQGSAIPPCTGNFHSKIDVQVHSSGSIKVRAGIVVAGSILPLPKITKFAAFGGINGSVDAQLHLDLAIAGGFTYEKKLISDMGLPGLSIPPLVTVGPYVSLAARAQGHLELDLTADVHLSYVFNDLEVWYPKEHANLAKKNGMQSRQSDLNLQASAHLNAKGFAQGTLVPQVHFGLSAIGGAVSASIYVGAEAWLRATVQAQADASVGVGGKHKRDGDIAEYIPPYLHQTRELAAASIGFSGCLWLDAGLALKGGAQGGIAGWQGGGEISIWTSPDWALFSKCWAVGAAKEPKGVSKPTWTITQVDALSKEKQTCSNHPEISAPIKDKLDAKPLNA